MLTFIWAFMLNLHHLAHQMERSQNSLDPSEASTVKEPIIKSIWKGKENLEGDWVIYLFIIQADQYDLLNQLKASSWCKGQHQPHITAPWLAAMHYAVDWTYAKASKGQSKVSK